MKNSRILIAFTICIIILGLNSCKKCYNCENICYYCSQSITDTLCSDDFTSMETFNAVVNDINSSSNLCKKIQATKELEVCKEVDKKILENVSFNCE